MTERGVRLGSSMGTGRGWRGEEGTKSGGNDVGQKGREGRETGEEGRDGQQVIERRREGGQRRCEPGGPCNTGTGAAAVEMLQSASAATAA